MTTSAQRSDWGRKLAAALVARGVIDKESADTFMSESNSTGKPLALIASEKGVAPQAILEVASTMSGLRIVDLVSNKPNPAAVKMVPPAIASEFSILGVSLEGTLLTVACIEPLQMRDVWTLTDMLGCEIQMCLGDPIILQKLMNALYSGESGSQFTPPPSNAVPPPIPPVAAPQPASAPPPPNITPPPPPPPSINVPPARTAEVGSVPTPPPPSAVPPPIPPVAAPQPASVPPPPNITPPPPNIIAGPEPVEKVPVMKDVNELLIYAVEHGSSDLHLSNRLPPSIRVDGSIRPVEGQPPLDNEQIREMVYSILTQGLRERFEANKELDTSHAIMGVGRFRVNVFQQRGSIGAVFRTIPHEIPAFDSLGLPESIKNFTELRRGLVLVTGPTGSGKSTTLAALINIINHSRPLHIMTVEDPIEFLHTHGKSIVNQREVGSDTKSFSEALRHVLRQDPDVILVGEMRDLETISTALTAAETGHLVFATLHTQDAPQTVDRIIDVFPTNQQDQVRIQLAGSIEGIVTQQLVVSASGVGRIGIAEVLVATPAIRNLIRSAKTHQIYSLMQTGAQFGMQTMDQALAKAVKAGMITEAVAYDRARDEAELRNYLRQN